jgi:GNAT superfamily N-acetyltransferase
MKIVEYDDVNPLKVTYLTQLALDFALTPEMVARIRQSDPRSFPCLAIYAEADREVLGQIAIFRLPMISTLGREDVGGIWAVSTHPQYAGSGIASSLLDEAHARMRDAGLRFSTLGANRYHVTYKLYRQHGYVETNVWATALARWETAHQPTRLRAQPLEPEGYDFVDQTFLEIAQEYLGFAWRHIPFDRLRRVVNLEDIWLLKENNLVIGYALTQSDQTLLKITNLVLRRNIDPAEAVAAVAAQLKSVYIQVKVSRPVEITSLRLAGFQIAQPTWDGFMIKPLVSEVTFEDAKGLFGIGTDSFLISWLDIT